MPYAKAPSRKKIFEEYNNPVGTGHALSSNKNANNNSSDTTGSFKSAVSKQINHSVKGKACLAPTDGYLNTKCDKYAPSLFNLCIFVQGFSDNPKITFPFLLSGQPERSFLLSGLKGQ